MLDFFQSLIGELFSSALENGLLEGVEQHWIAIIIALAVLLIAVGKFVMWVVPKIHGKLPRSYSLKDGVLTIYKPLFSSRMKAYRYNIYPRIVGKEMRLEIRINSAPWFDERANIEKVVIQEGVTHISRAAFAECSNLKDVYLPKNLVSIGDYAFNDCVSLGSVSLPRSILDIGKYAFNQCEKLTGVHFIPTNFRKRNTGEIEDGAFRYCKKLKGIVIPYGVTNIGNSAFHSCSALTSVYIPDSVTSIDRGTFVFCNALTSVEVPAGAEIDPYAFDSHTTVTRRAH